MAVGALASRGAFLRLPQPAATAAAAAAGSGSAPRLVGAASASVRLSFRDSAAFGCSIRSASSPATQSRSFRAGMAKATAATFAGKTFHDFTVKDIEGKDVSLSQYKGKVALVVNVASACGLTDSNYKELTAIYDKYKDQGLEILAFPSNQFGAQEPGSNEQIKQFACSRYKATFPLFSKIDVNGANTEPVYQFLKSQKGGGFLGDNIKWNFGKFLVDKDGKVVERYAPTTSPMAIEADIKKLL